MTIKTTDDVLLRFICELHAHLPEAQRPMSWSDFSDGQAERARAAWLNVMASLAMAPEPELVVRDAP